MKASFLLQRELKKQVDIGRLKNPHFFPHFHSHIEIYLILSGEVEILINDQKKILGPGEFSVAHSYDTHAYRTPKAAEAIYLIIPTCFCKEFLPILSGRCLPSPYINDPCAYKTLLEAMEKLIAGGNEITQRGLLYVILGEIYAKMLPKSDKSTTVHQASAEILIYLGEHFKEELTLSCVARAFGYNDSYFSRYFRETFGISFIRYLTMLRLREAILLLESGKSTVTEAAIESGFGSIRSFYRAFDDEFGCTPTEYLKQTGAK